jgi:hypothetical protein
MKPQNFAPICGRALGEKNNGYSLSQNLEHPLANRMRLRPLIPIDK